MNTTYVAFDTPDGNVYVRKDSIVTIETMRHMHDRFIVCTGAQRYVVLGTPDTLFAGMVGNDAEINTPAGDA